MGDWNERFDRPYEIRDALAYEIHERHFPREGRPSCGWEARPGICAEASRVADKVLNNWPESVIAVMGEAER